MNKKYYRAICVYETICNNAFLERANSPEEAEEQAKKDFKKWNENWMKEGGNEKKLLKIEIEKA